MTVLSGIPWQMHSLRDVQTLLGKPFGERERDHASDGESSKWSVRADVQRALRAEPDRRRRHAARSKEALVYDTAERGTPVPRPPLRLL